MKKVFKNKKFLIYIACVLILAILIVGGIWLFKREPADSKVTSEQKETKNNYIAYIKINPLVKLELSQTCKNNNCSEPIITNYNLINDDAKEMYKDIDFKDKSLLDIIPILADTVYNNGINFNNISIQTDWKDIYSKEEIEKAITDSSTQNNKYKVIIDIEKDINESEIAVDNVKTKEFKTNRVAAVATLNFNHDYIKTSNNAIIYTVIVNDGRIADNTIGVPYTIKLFGSEEDINNIDTNKLDLVVDLNDYTGGNHNGCGYYDVRPTLYNINENIYYTIEPSTFKLDVWHWYIVNINNINKQELNNFLNSNNCSHYFVDFQMDDFPVARCSSNKYEGCHWLMKKETTSNEIINFASNWFGAKYIDVNWTFQY